MATLNLGKLKFNWRGNWATETAYAVDDVVFDNGTSWIVTTAVAATNTTRPEASDDFEVMAPGFNFRGDFDDANTYFENDVVTHDSAVFLATSDNDPADGNEPNTSPLNSNWDEIVPAPENNVLTTIGDLLYRDNTGANARLAIGAEGAGLTVQQDPRESIPSRAIRYDEPDNNHGRARDQNDQSDANTTFGTTDNNGVIFCTRGLTYTITVEVSGSTRNYNLHTDASGEATNLLGTDHAGSANANVTNGSGTLNFQPDATTPDDVYIRDHNNSGRNVRIRVVDMALTPSWGDAPTEDSLVLDTPDGDNTLTLATQDMAANNTYTLPAAFPTGASQYLTSDTSGNTSWNEVTSKLLNVWSIPHSTASSTSSSTFAQIPGWLQELTPASADSKFFIMIDVKFGSTSHGSPQYKLQRSINNASFTDIAIHTAGSLGSSPQVTGGSYTPTASHAQYDQKQYVNNFLDSPNTTSTVAYRVVWREAQNGSYTNYLNAPGYAITGSDRGIYVARGHSNFAIFEFAD